jgi:hypothetical protein
MFRIFYLFISVDKTEIKKYHMKGDQELQILFEIFFDKVHT